MVRALDSYRSKRDFARTSEPRGSRTKREKQPRFVVQKHDARRLHYDLRLEIDGVLKSWAITRGPSLVPTDKRLAVETEDHPLDYLAWEGAIPKGQYGGGTMIVWDTGTFTPEGDVAAGLAKGHLDFSLHGQRLQGRWHLVRMKGKQEAKRPWLLIKADDALARAPDDADILDAHDESVLSGRSNADLAKSGAVRPDHAARQRVRASRGGKTPTARGGKKAILPPFVEPALASPALRAPNGPDWLFEIKYDGYRLQARIDGGKVKLLTRSGLDWSAKFEPLAKSLKALGLPAALIDGEVVAEGAGGLPSFSALQKVVKDGKPEALVYYAFDLLHLDGSDLRGLPLVERKALLAQALDDAPKGSPVRFSEHLVEDGEAMARHACRLGLEGIIAKRADAPYRSGRSDTWRKIKCTASQDAVIAGFMPATIGPRAVGSLILGLHENKRLVHVGRVGTGFGHDVARELYQQLAPLRIEEPPFAETLPPLAKRNAVWVAPRLVCEVTVRAWTADGIMRHASFKTLRPDVKPETVRREAGMSEAASKAQSTTKRRGKRIEATAGKSTPSAVRLTHPDRVLWADIGLTKQGLFDYYAAIAERILPHVANRPLSLLRCPDGVGDCFYQKHAWSGLDETHLKSATVGQGKDGQSTVVVEDAGGLLALVQASVLEIHPWGATLADPERPDRLIFDLDPGEGVGWEALVAGAFAVRERLEKDGLAAFAKTSGGKGLHVVAPLNQKADWATAKAFSKALAEAMAKDRPDLYVATVTKAKRNAKVFVDYLRNQRGQTAVAPYSTRARPGAPVSTPVTWDELPDLGSGARFTVETLPTRLAVLKRDPWAGFARAAKGLI